MITAGPTPQSDFFTAKIAIVIAENKKALESLGDNAHRTRFILNVLHNQKMALSDIVVPLIFASLRENGLTDHTQPLIEVIQQNTDYLNSCKTNSGRAAFLTARLATTTGARFTQAQILGVLQNEGFANKPQNTQAPYFAYAMMLFSFYTILGALQRNPGHYARNLTVDLTTRTIGSSVGQDNKKLIAVFYLMMLFIQLSVMFGFMPSLGSLFKYLPEDLDPKTYADEFVPSLAESYGNTAYYALVPLIMLMQKYGPLAVANVLKKMFDNPLLTSAHEFCTLMRGGDDADELLQQRPQLADSVAVKGITWGFNARQSHTTEASNRPAVTSDATLRIAP